MLDSLDIVDMFASQSQSHLLLLGKQLLPVVVAAVVVHSVEEEKMCSH